jgi:hypothetical protein
MIGDDGRDTSCDAARATRGATPQTMVSPDAATQFADLPWAQLVPQVAAWQPQRRRRTPMQHPGEDADAPPPDRLPPNPFGDPS